MNTPPTRKKTYMVIGVVFILVCVVYISRLISLQMSAVPVSSDEAVTYKRTVAIPAVRGEIFDRNGNPLVTNRSLYNITLDAKALTKKNEKINQTILTLLSSLEKKVDLSIYNTTYFPVTGSYPHVTYDYEMLKNTTASSRLSRYLSKHSLGEDISCEDLIRFMLDQYEIEEAWLTELLPSTVHFFLGLRYDMDRVGFDTDQLYVLATDISDVVLTTVLELSLRGVGIQLQTERVYEYPGYCSHILGKVGKIHSADLEYYTEQGYPMDAIVGTEGAEKAFEMYLRGVDGEMMIEEDEEGNIVNQYVTVEPIAGQNIWLTIDIELQKIAEDALAENIRYIAETGAASGEERHGEDADVGACTVVDPNTGEVLALASYPTFNWETFSENYSDLTLNELRPLYNRALLGQYAPGSTFKPSVAIAALEEGIIDRYTKINDTGVYMFYAPSYTPACWIYPRIGAGHGPITVTQAISVSCNYFFFEIGRLLGIDTMNTYAKNMGLGQYTGIELPETKGVLAGPDSRGESAGSVWVAGDTISAAIGQNDNAFSPLQLSVYTGTIAIGGVRYQTHLLYQVTEFYTEEVVYKYEPKIVSSVSMSSETLSLIKTGMQSAIQDSSVLRSLFSSYDVTVCAKTGTAQWNTQRSDNAVLSSFAPMESPQIAVAAVIEGGYSGANCGYMVKAIYDYYFGIESDGNPDMIQPDQSPDDVIE